MRIDLQRISRAGRSPWLPIVGIATALALVSAFAPIPALLILLTLAVTGALIWRFGAREGVWYTLVATIPLREPLSVDIHGTVSFYFTDLILLVLFVETVRRTGLREMWRRSPFFRIGLVILGLSMLGLYSASRLFWGIAAAYRIAGQITLFYVARDRIRKGTEATRTMVAILIGLAPAVVYGLYQASLPYDAPLPDWASRLTAYDPGGEPHIRIFSTFSHPLRFSHYLSVGLGIALGLMNSGLSRSWKAATMAVGAAAAYCNLFTYSIGGIVGMLAGGATFLFINRRRRIILITPFLLVLWILFSPTALLTKAERVLSGRAVTAAARMITYQQSIDILKDHPLIGVGWGGIRGFLENEYRVTRASAVAFSAENYFLQRGMALGVPGIALFLLLCILFFRNTLKGRGDRSAEEWPRSALLAGGIAFYLQAQAFPAAEETSNYLLWLLFAIAEGMREMAGRDKIYAWTETDGEREASEQA